MTIPFTWLRALRAFFAQNDMSLCVLQQMVTRANVIVDMRLGAGISWLIESNQREVHHRRRSTDLPSRK